MFETYKHKIINFYEEAKRMPTYKELMNMTGFKSKNAVFKLINKLVEVGVLEKDSQGKITPGSAYGYGEVAMLSQTVSAGYGALVEEEEAEHVNLQNWLLGKSGSESKTFMMTVKGDSMIDAGVFDGDTLLVEKCNLFKEGDMVVALMNDGYTVKYLRRKKTKQGIENYLQPANKNYRDIYSTEDDMIQLVAVVKAVIRKL